MSRLNTFSLAPRSIPRSAAATVSSVRANAGSGSKKGYAGTVAGIRGNRPGPTPSTSFPRVQLGPRLAQPAAAVTAARPRSLLSRVATRVRAAAFGL